MSNYSRNDGLSLLQRNPSRDLLLEKMRSKLATTPTQAVEQNQRKHEVRRKSAASWTVRIAIVLSLIGANFLFIGNKNTIVAKLGMESVPTLPVPQNELSVDDQALYWTYAMYDFAKFRKQFGVNGYFAINQVNARRSLEALLPDVSPETLGLISAYTSVAFKTVNAGAE